MINQSTVRANNKAKFKECLRLRKLGFSYSEIRKIVPLAKSTLQNWLTLGGLTLTQEHLEIQLHKRIEKRQAAVEASKITRRNKREQLLKTTVEEYKRFFADPLFITGIILYEAEGSKANECRFSNSDYRLIKTFIFFLKKYFRLRKNRHIRYSLFIHETRKRDLPKIREFWSVKLSIPVSSFTIFWKKNKIIKKRENPDYVGQIQIRVVGVPYLTRKLLMFSDIIIGQYL